MQATEKIWFNGKFVPWNEATIHVLSHSLHYGSGAFEGIRVYETERGPAIFCLNAHVDRLFYSAESVRMKLPWSKAEFIAAIIETVKINKLKAGYIRPLMFYGYGELRVGPGGCPVEAIIAAYPWGAYLGDEAAKIKTASVIRIHPRSSVTDAKICGHYVNSMLAVTEVVPQGYTEALLLDYQGNIAEGPGENFFMVKDGIIYTPPLGTILAGITRRKVIELAEDFGYQVIEKALTLTDAYGADECFFTGTAAEITPIQSIDDQPIKNAVGPITDRLKSAFSDIVRGKNSKYHPWLTWVN